MRVLLGVNHLGIIVRDLETVLTYYVETLGLQATAIEELPAAGVRVVYLEAGPDRIQLLQPTGPGPAQTVLDERGEGPDHICYTVEDIPAALAVLAPGQTVPMHQGGRGRRACFLPGTHHGLRIELTEREPRDVRQAEGAV